jgi:hypothetical protein
MHSITREAETNRGRIGQECSLLDLIVSAEENAIADIGYKAPLGKSDHCIITFKTASYFEKEPSTVKKFLYDKADYCSMKKISTDWDWKSEFQ